MYMQFFGLKKKPFTLTSDPTFFYFSKNHDLAFTHLKNGLVHNVGFMALTGSAGTGKTTLLRYLINHIRSPFNIAMIFNTQIDTRSLLEMLVKDFEITPPSNRRSDLYHALYEFFAEQNLKQARCLIFVDEAQNLSLSSFEELRMLSNFDGNEPLVQIVLVGQPRLRSQLAHPLLAQLTQRISVHFHLAPLQSNDIRGYIDHRLYVAGAQRGATIFENEAMDRIAEISKGVPRVINSICDASLACAFAEKLKRVPVRVVEKVVSDNELLLGGKADIETFSSEGHDVIDAPNQWPFFDGSDSHRELNAPATPGLTERVSTLIERISSLEERLAEADAAESDRIISIFLEVLAKEREKNLQLAIQLADLKSRYKDKAKCVESGRRLWRVFSRGKK
jgi:general secretion pathway protein A